MAAPLLAFGLVFALSAPALAGPDKHPRRPPQRPAAVAPAPTPPAPPKFPAASNEACAQVDALLKKLEGQLAETITHGDAAYASARELAPNADSITFEQSKAFQEHHDFVSAQITKMMETIQQIDGQFPSGSDVLTQLLHIKIGTSQEPFKPFGMALVGREMASLNCDFNDPKLHVCQFKALSQGYLSNVMVGYGREAVETNRYEAFKKGASDGVANLRGFLTQNSCKAYFDALPKANCDH